MSTSFDMDEKALTSSMRVGILNGKEWRVAKSILNVDPEVGNGSMCKIDLATSMSVLRLCRRWQVHCRFLMGVLSLFVVLPRKCAQICADTEHRQAVFKKSN
jgi:hypothetical protein